jgi:hypothetical protein
VLEDHDFLAYQYFMILGRTADVRASEPAPGATPPESNP